MYKTSDFRFLVLWYLEPVLESTGILICNLYLVYCLRYQVLFNLLHGPAFLRQEDISTFDSRQLSLHPTSRIIQGIDSPPLSTYIHTIITTSHNYHSHHNQQLEPCTHHRQQLQLSS